MPIASISEIGKHDGETVTIRGWLYNLRESGKLLFPIFRDGSGVIQGVVAKNAVAPEVFESLKGLTQESSVIVEGKVRADKRAPGGYELDVIAVEVVQRVSESDPYPISLKEHGVDFLMDHRRGAPGMAGQRLDTLSAGSGPLHRARSRGNHQSGKRLFRRSRIHAYRSTHHHTSRLRRNHNAIPGGLFRRAGISHAVRTALYRSDRYGAG